MNPAIETVLVHLRSAANELLAEANRVRAEDYKRFENLMEVCVQIVCVEKELERVPTDA